MADRIARFMTGSSKQFIKMGGAVSSSANIITDGALMLIDASNVSSYPGSGTTWTDLSGNGNNTTLVNNPTYNQGQSFTFNGSNSYCTSLFSFTSRPFSINVWFSFNNISGWQTVVGQDTSQNTAYGTLYFQKSNGNNTGVGGTTRTINAFGLSLVTTNSVEVYCFDPALIKINTWYNYCVSVATDSIKLYRNGVLVTNVNDSSTLATPVGTAVVAAGYYGNSIVDYCNARVSSVSIYNRALSAVEIRHNYNALRGRFGI